MRLNLNKYHLYFWILYATFILFLDFITYRQNFNLVREFIVFFIEIWVFYSFLYVLITNKNGSFYSILKTLCVFIFSLSGTFFLNYIRGRIAKQFGVEIFKNNRYLINDSISFFIQFAFISIAYFYAIRFGIKQKESRVLEQSYAENEKNKLSLEFENANLQKELIQSENDYLRSQINPHFLYNCLNFLYSKTFQQQPKVAEAIMTLSQIMRYSLADFSSNNGLANLKDEITHIENIIKINKFRFADQLQLRFDIEGSPTNKRITPMLLITLTENVFKHGDLQDKTLPAVIKCKIDKVNKILQFTTYNKKGKTSFDTSSNTSSGLGLNNMKHRLKLLYDNSFKLSINNSGILYQTELIIPYFDAD